MAKDRLLLKVFLAKFSVCVLRIFELDMFLRGRISQAHRWSTFGRQSSCAITFEQSVVGSQYIQLLQLFLSFWETLLYDRRDI